MITVIALNHLITCFNHYIFDSNQTHAVYRMEENLKFNNKKIANLLCFGETRVLY